MLFALTKKQSLIGGLIVRDGVSEMGVEKKGRFAPALSCSNWCSLRKRLLQLIPAWQVQVLVDRRVSGDYERLADQRASTFLDRILRLSSNNSRQNEETLELPTGDQGYKSNYTPARLLISERRYTYDAGIGARVTPIVRSYSVIVNRLRV